jgi:putative peptide zinc metalloprotease protein
VVKNPSTGRFFQFREAECFIAQQLDGSTPLEVVRRRTEERFRSPLSDEALHRFIETLRRFGLLDGSGPSPGTPGTGNRVRGSLLYLRFKAFDPDRFLNRLVPRLRWLFTPSVAILALGFILVALGIAIQDGWTIARGLPRLDRVDVLILIWVTLVGITILHEFAHAIACKHFGGSVHEMGFLLLYFQPALYCNVSDAWLFADKWKRVWVMFAGAYVELCFWAMATLTWRGTEPGTTPYQLSLVVMATLGVKTLFNLNPLIKLDGYYLLCDLLEIPNLRSRSFRHLRSRLTFVTGGRKPSSEEGTPKERCLYLAYAVLAGTFSIWLLVLISSYAAKYLVGHYQGWGFVAFTGLMLSLFRGPLRAASSPLRSAIEGKPKRGLSRFHVLLAIFGLAVIAVLLVHVDLKVAGEFSILPARNADVRADVEGTIEQIFVREGQRVQRGDSLVQISDRDSRAEVEKIRLEIAERAAKQRMLAAGATHEQVDVAMTTAAKARDRVDYAQRELQRLETLYARQLTSQRELDQAKETAGIRDKELKEAEGNLRILRAGARQEEIEAGQAELDRLMAQQRHEEGKVARARVTSPIAGVIATPKLEHRVGEYVRAGDLIVKVLELRTVTAEIAVSEKEIADVEVGSRVDLRARAMPWKTVRGVVTSIAPTVTAPDQAAVGPRSVTVTTTVENPSLILKPDMTGIAKIYCGKHSVAGVLTRRFARYLRVDFWSWW